jgi:hypothetical protein
MLQLLVPPVIPNCATSHLIGPHPVELVGVIVHLLPPLAWTRRGWRCLPRLPPPAAHSDPLHRADRDEAQWRHRPRLGSPGSTYRIARRKSRLPLSASPGVEDVRGTGEGGPTSWKARPPSSVVSTQPCVAQLAPQPILLLYKLDAARARLQLYRACIRARIRRNMSSHIKLFDK